MFDIPQALRAEFNGVEATPPDSARCASIGPETKSSAQPMAAANLAATIELRISTIITT
jgi:hypothetical protein